MLTDTQERMFDLYFRFVDHGDLENAGHILSAIRCTLGKQDEIAPVVKLLEKQPGSTLKDIVNGTGYEVRKLSRILQRGEFQITMTNKGCLYAIKGTDINAPYDAHSGGSVASDREMPTVVI